MTTAQQHSQMRPIGWRVAIPTIVVLIGITIAAYWETASSIVLIWMRSETFTHGFLVPPIAGWLIWRQRAQLARIRPTPHFWVLLLVAGAAIAWLLGDLAAVNAVTQLSFVAMMVLLVPALLGLAVTRAIIFPLAFLFFAVPIGEFAMPQLMVWTADFTVAALRLTGIPVYREGLQFVIPSGNWSVVEACSGVRYLIASVTVGTLFAYLNYQSTHRRLLFIGVSILVPVLANWLRAYIIVMLGHFSGNKLATGADHLVYGWLFFGVVIMVMFMVGARWSEAEETKTSDEQLSVVGTQREAAPAKYFFVALCFGILVCLPQTRLLTMKKPPVGFAAELKELRPKEPEWQAARPEGLEFKPAFQNPSAQSNSAFSSGGRQVGLYIGFYQDQDANRKLVSTSNALVEGAASSWVVVKSAQNALALSGKNETLRTTELREQSGGSGLAGSRLEVWQIYWISGTLTSSDYAAKVYSAFYRLLGQGDDSAVIVVYTKKDAGSGSQDVLRRFLDDHYPQIDANLSALKRQN